MLKRLKFPLLTGIMWSTTSTPHDASSEDAWYDDEGDDYRYEYVTPPADHDEEFMRSFRRNERNVDYFDRLVVANSREIETGRVEWNGLQNEVLTLRLQLAAANRLREGAENERGEALSVHDAASAGGEEARNKLNGVCRRIGRIRDWLIAGIPVLI